MNLSISLFSVILIIVIINEVLAHLLNWALRASDYKGESAVITYIFYFLKTMVVVLLLKYYLE